MVKVVAIHAVHTLARAAKVTDEGKVLQPAKIAEHAPGDVFDVDQETFEDLRAEDAVRKATKVDITAAAAKQTGSKKFAADLDEDDEDEDDDPLEKLTKEELLAKGAELDLDVKPAMNKAELIAAIRAAG